LVFGKEYQVMKRNYANVGVLKVFIIGNPESIAC
jgi:hypothetical protein